MQTGPSLSHREWRAAVTTDRVIWKRHALRRMGERNISESQVRSVLIEGECIEEYPEDFPYPSALFFAYVGNRPLHVVAAFDDERKRAIIVTIYEPDSDHFESNYRTRRTQ